MSRRARRPNPTAAPAAPRRPIGPIIVLVLAVIGIGVAGYLWYCYVRCEPPFCFGLSSCSSVQNSPYAYLLGLPVAAWGAAAYVVIAAATALRLAVAADGWLNAEARLAVFGVALVGAIFSVYLQIIAVFVLASVCVWCFVSAVLMVAIFVLAARDV